MARLPIECTIAEYSEGILTGNIPAAKITQHSVRRHLEDLKSGNARGLYFDTNEAQFAVDFFGLITHSKGEWAGQPLVLAPWQAFVTAMVFGWKRADGTRRFRTAYTTVARKNGKSTWAAGVGLKMLVADQEPGAEVYTAATKREQARITHEEATRSVRSNPSFRRLVTIRRDNLHVVSTNSKYEPLGADADTLDGLNPSGMLIDEIQAHKTRAVWDVLETATGSRRQPLAWVIGTAGFDKDSIAWEVHDYATSILEQTIEDDSFFAFIAGIDPEDDWRDQRCWGKANPNLGISVKEDDLARLCKKAERMPRAQNAFRRLRLNEWTEQESRWIDMESWRGSAGRIDVNALTGRPCVGGLDLASRYDLASLVLVFVEDGDYKLLPYFWLPEDTARERERKDHIPYTHWAKAGYLDLTPGATVDYGRIEHTIDQAARRFAVQKIAYDPWNATQIRNNVIERGSIEMIEFPQTIKNYNEPSKEFERLLLEKRVHHANHPVLSWCAQNVTARTDPSGNIRPVKPEHGNPKKVDGITAAIMGMALALLQTPQPSIYEEHGIRSV